MLLASFLASVSTVLVPAGVHMIRLGGVEERKGTPPSFMILEKSSKDSSPASTCSEMSTQISLPYTPGVFLNCFFYVVSLWDCLLHCLFRGQGLSILLTSKLSHRRAY